MERNSGFTLIELLVSLAVIALILSVGVPSYQSIVARSVITSTGNDLLSAVSLARSEALRRDGAVTLQAAAPQAGNALGEGYCIVVDNPGNCSGTLIKRVAPAPGELSIDIVGATALTFDGLGGLSGTGGATRLMTVCRDGYDGRQLLIALSGRVKVSEYSGC